MSLQEDTEHVCQVQRIPALQRVCAPDIKASLQSQRWHFKKETLKPKWPFSPSFQFGIHQSQTQGMWWHPKSLWLIHAGPQTLPLSATWWSSYHHLVFLSARQHSRNSSHHMHGAGLSAQMSYRALYANLFYLHPPRLPCINSLATHGLFTRFPHPMNCLMWGFQLPVLMFFYK
jgi:hypothetical protein